MRWATDDPKRFFHERTELDRLAGEVDGLDTAWRIDADGTIEVDFDLVVHGHTYAGRMTYPDVFPDSPPYIRPRDPSERWTDHQYGPGGSLCLQWRADNWQTQITGADIVRSAIELLSTERHPEQPGVVPSAHRETDGQSMRSKEYRAVATDDLLRSLLALPQQSVTALKTRTILNRTATVAFIIEISTPENAAQKIVDLPSGISTYIPLFALRGEGRVFRSEGIVAGARITSVDELLRTLSESGFQTDNILVKEEGASEYKEMMVVMLGSDSSSLRIFSLQPGDRPELREHSIIMPSIPGARLPEECGELSRVRIGIVGLGSIGSKVAISLARSGVRRFLLVDDDYLVPGNLVRHELSWTSVGLHKVNAVRDELTLVAAGVDVDVRSHRIAGQESAVNAAAALKDLANCDLLLDATANPEVFLRMAAIAKVGKKPLCWGELFSGGYGGLIARAPRHRSQSACSPFRHICLPRNIAASAFFSKLLDTMSNRSGPLSHTTATWGRLPRRSHVLRLIPLWERILANFLIPRISLGCVRNGPLNSRSIRDQSMRTETVGMIQRGPSKMRTGSRR